MHQIGSTFFNIFSGVAPPDLRFKLWLITGWLPVTAHLHNIWPPSGPIWKNPGIVTSLQPQILVASLFIYYSSLVHNVHVSLDCLILFVPPHRHKFESTRSQFRVKNYIWRSIALVHMGRAAEPRHKTTRISVTPSGRNRQRSTIAGNSYSYYICATWRQELTALPDWR